MSKYFEFKGKIKSLNEAELVTQARDLETQIAKLTLEMGVRKVKNLRSRFMLRKQLAAIKTLISQKKS